MADVFDPFESLELLEPLTPAEVDDLQRNPLGFPGRRPARPRRTAPSQETESGGSPERVDLQSGLRASRAPSWLSPLPRDQDAPPTSKSPRQKGSQQPSIIQDTRPASDRQYALPVGYWPHPGTFCLSRIFAPDGLARKLYLLQQVARRGDPTTVKSSPEHHRDVSNRCWTLPTIAFAPKDTFVPKSKRENTRMGCA